MARTRSIAINIHMSCNDGESTSRTNGLYELKRWEHVCMRMGQLRCRGLQPGQNHEIEHLNDKIKGKVKRCHMAVALSYEMVK